MESKISATNSEKKLLVARGEGWGMDKINEGEWEIQAYNFGKNKSWG